jgi:hypothetical protein
MDFSYQLTVENTSYLWGSLLLLPLWLLGYIKNKDSRKEMVICGVLFGITAVAIGYLYANKDYWNPPYIFNNVLHLEDFLYGFLFGGISAEIYEIVLGFRDERINMKRRLYLLPVFLIITILCFYLLIDLLGWNSIFAHILPPFIVGLLAITFRKDFILPTILAGIFMLIVTFLWQKAILLLYPSMISDYWLMDNLSGNLITGVPIEELIFAFALGFGASSFYELVMGYEYVK